MSSLIHTSGPPFVRVKYAQGIIALFPYLEDIYRIFLHGYISKIGPYNPEWVRIPWLKSIKRKTAEERGASISKSPKSKIIYQLEIIINGLAEIT